VPTDTAPQNLWPDPVVTSAVNELVVTSNTPTWLAPRGAKITFVPTAAAPQNLSVIVNPVLTSAVNELVVTSNTPTT